MTKRPNPAASAAAKPCADGGVGLPMPDVPAAFVFYDTETSGLSKAFDQILQIAAVRTDADLGIAGEAADSFSVRARRLPWVVPNPSAMRITRVSPADLEAQPLSSYELMAEVAKRFDALSPAIFIGHNTIRFDEEMLRHGLFAALQDTYPTQLHGNMRADTLIMLHAVHLLAPGCISIPMVDAKCKKAADMAAAAAAAAAADAAVDGAALPTAQRPSFKLGDIARANAIPLDEADAHDALADVKATIEVARLIRDKAPDIFQMMLANANKMHVQDRLQQPWMEFNAAGRMDTVAVATDAMPDSHQNVGTYDQAASAPPFEPMLLGHVFGAKTSLKPVLLMDLLPDNRNAAIVVDLSIDPDEWLNADEDALKVWMDKNPHAFRKIRINAFPILAPFNLAAQLASPVFRGMCQSVVGHSDDDRSAGASVAAIDGHGHSKPHDTATLTDAARTILSERMLRIMAHLPVNPETRRKVLAAFASRQKVYPPSPFIEENLYNGFPSKADQMLVRRLHSMSMAERVQHIPALQDERLREHAWRWVFAEDPDALPPDQRERLTQWLFNRVRGDQLTNERPPYLTTTAAIGEVINMHRGEGDQLPERDQLAKLAAVEAVAEQQRLTELMDYYVFIHRMAEEMVEHQQALTIAANTITSGFDGVAPAEETIRTVIGARILRTGSKGAPPHASDGSSPIDPDIDF